MQPILTVFVAFTRQWALATWLANLEAVEHDPAQTNLCLIVDIDDQYIVRAFKALAENKGYRSFHMKINTGWHPNEVRLSIRRMRVADVKNQSKDLIAKTDGEIVLAFEDDTVFDRLPSFSRLYQPLLDDPKVGFVEGVQMGRWGARMIGAWDCDDFEFPQKVWTLLPGEGYEEITGGGFYGYATRRDLYLNHDYHTASSQPWGPDVNYGFWLKQRGYKCLIDWESVFGHNDHNQIGYPDDPKHPLVKVTYTKDITTGKWQRMDYEKRG